VVLRQIFLQVRHHIRSKPSLVAYSETYRRRGENSTDFSFSD
jgi:hypothetical protein